LALHKQLRSCVAQKLALQGSPAQVCPPDSPTFSRPTFEALYHSHAVLGSTPRTTAQSGVTFQDRADSSGATMKPLWRRPPTGDACPVELAVIDAPWGVRAGAVPYFPSASTGIG
jgi:hypothetical protein